MKKKIKIKKTKKYDMSKGNVRCNMNIGKTINTGNYSSIRIDFGIARDLQRSESTGECFKKMDDFLVAYMDKYVNEKDIVEGDN